MNRTKTLQLLQTVVGVITLNINGEERVFTVFYGGAMYPWIDNKMLVMPEAKYNEMLKNFFKGEGQEYIVPSSTQIAQDRATVINNYRAGLYLNPDAAPDIANNANHINNHYESDDLERPENHLEDYTEKETGVSEDISINHTENDFFDKKQEPEKVLTDSDVESYQDKEETYLESNAQNNQNQEVQDESHLYENNIATEKKDEDEQKNIQENDVVAENYNDAETNIEDVRDDEAYISNKELEDNTETTSFQEEISGEHKTLPTDQIEEKFSDGEEVNEKATNYEDNNEILKEAELKISELNKENKILKEQIAEIKAFYREIKNENSENLTQKIDVLINESQKPNKELIDIKNKIAELNTIKSTPDEKLSQLSNNLQDLIKRNENVNLDQIKNLVDEQNSMMSKQSDTIQELTRTVESQKTIIDNFQAKMDKTEKAEKGRMAKTWIIMIFGIIAMVGVMVCTQLFLPRAESAITLDPNTDAEIHIVVHNEDGTDSFERIGSLIIKNGKVQLSD